MDFWVHGKDLHSVLAEGDAFPTPARNLCIELIIPQNQRKVNGNPLNFLSFVLFFPLPPAVFFQKWQNTEVSRKEVDKTGPGCYNDFVKSESSSDEVEGRFFRPVPEETDGAIPRLPALGESFRSPVPSMDETLESTAPGGRRRSNAFRSRYRGYTGTWLRCPYIFFYFLFSL